MSDTVTAAKLTPSHVQRVAEYRLSRFSLVIFRSASYRVQQLEVDEQVLLFLRWTLDKIIIIIIHYYRKTRYNKVDLILCNCCFPQGSFTLQLQNIVIEQEN